MPESLRRICAFIVWSASYAAVLFSNWNTTSAAITLPTAGINAAGYSYWGTSLPFFDVAHMGEIWGAISRDGTTLTDRSFELNSLGYPVSLEHDVIARAPVFLHNGGKYPTGQYVLSWSGNGSVRLASSPEVTIVSQSTRKIVYNVSAVSDMGMWIQITETDPVNPVSNIGLHAPLGDADGAIGPKYNSDMANYGVIRNLDLNHTNNQTISKWADRTTLYDMFWGTDRGVPYEAQIQLSNETKKDLWLTVPHLADDDYVRNLAALVAQRLSPELRVWVEYSNEVWNGSFQQYIYARDVLAPRYGMNTAQSYGRRSAEVFDAFEQGFNDKKRIVRVIAGQAVSPAILDNSLQGATIDGTLKADVAAVAPYFTVDVDALYQRHLAGNVNMDDIFTEMRASIDDVMTHVVENRRQAEARGVPLVAYEGGQHLIARPGEQHNDAAFVELLQRVNRDPRMGELYTYYLDQWYAAGGKTMTLYNDTGAYSKWGSWGLKESYQDDNSPKFRAVQSYLERLEHEAADFNKDGAIDLADYQTWRLTVGTPILHADANGDGVVDSADYVAWRRVYTRSQQNSETGGAVGVQIPELSTVHIACWTVFLLVAAVRL